MKDEITIGTELFFWRDRYETYRDLDTIVRETKQFWITSDGRRVRKKDLLLYGPPTFHRIHVRVATEDDKRTMLRLNQIKEIRGADLYKASPATIGQIHNLLFP